MDVRKAADLMYASAEEKGAIAARAGHLRQPPFRRAALALAWLIAYDAEVAKIEDRRMVRNSVSERMFTL